MTKPWHQSRHVWKRWRNRRAALPARFDEFHDWLARDDNSRTGPWVSEMHRRESPAAKGMDLRSYAEAVFAEHPRPGITIDNESASLLQLEWPTELGHLLINVANTPPTEVIVTKKHIRLVEVRTKKQVRFLNCLIEEASLSDGPTHVAFVDCYIAKLKIEPRQAYDLHVEGGLLFRVTTPAFDVANSPFIGRTTIKRLYLPRDILEIIPQPLDSDRAKVIHEYRKIRTMLAAKNDGLAAGVFHAAELAFERPDESRWAQAFSGLYEVGCDFGNSITRPGQNIVAVFIAMALIVFSSDAVEPAEPKSLSGWQQELGGSGLWAQTLRAFIYPLLTIFNPLGILSSKPLLIAKSEWLSLPLTLLGLAGTFCVALAVISLRRRFRLE